MVEGLRILRGHLDPAEQRALVAEVLTAVAQAGWFTPRMPRTGRPFSVRMCNLGPLGWVSDERGYRYQRHHPATGRPWPPLPPRLLALWRDLARVPAEPECCLVNLYRPGARLGLHRDEDEETFEAPIVSISLGDPAVFRIGGLRRRDPTRRVVLESGDVVVMAGAARRIYHGIDRILAGRSALIPGGGRLNLTLRRVHRFDPAAGAVGGESTGEG